MHPNEFFSNVRLVSSAMTDDEKDKMLNMLKSVHPMNFLSSKLFFCISEIIVSYDTHSGNRKEAKKYSIQVLNVSSQDDLDMQAKIQAEADINKYGVIHRDSELKNFKVEDAHVIANAVLDIG